MDNLYFVSEIISSKLISDKRVENKRDFIECLSWSYENFKDNEGLNESLALFECAERNNKFREDFLLYYNKNEYITDDNKVNNKFYRNAKFRYDAVVPLNIYTKIMEHLNSIIDDDTQKEKVKYVLKNLDRIMMLCALISFRKTRYKNRHPKKQGMTQITHQMLTSILGKTFNKSMDYLCNDVKIVIWDKEYIPGIYDKTGNNSGLCRSYKFSEEASGIICHRIHDKVLIKRIYNDKDEDSELRHMNNESKVSKDDYLNEYFSKNFTLAEEAYKNKHIDLEGFTRYISKLSGNGDDKFKRFKIGRDTFGSRLYNPFLYLKKELREFILINGSSDTTNVDINNSHPYFFSMLFDERFLNSVKHLLNVDEYKIFHSFSKNANFMEKIDIFQKITSSGTYYNYLMQSLGMSNSAENFKKIKKMNMCYFYGRINKNNKIYKYFDDNFNFINIVKYSIIKQGSYKRLCQILQKVEAFVLIDGIFGDLMPKISLIPLHDGFQCNKSDVPLIESTLLNNFKRLGVKYLPTWNKSTSLEEFNVSLSFIKKAHFNLFINKNELLESLNTLLLYVGIRNKKFKEGMKDENKVYLDNRFERVREMIPDEVANTYYELRLRLESKDYIRNDYSEHYQEYERSPLMKRRYYGRNVIGMVKLNPVEFLNQVNNGTQKTRVKEQNYFYC